MRGQRTFVDVALTGLRTPSAGTVAARLGLFALEGDRSITPDQVLVSGQPLANATDPASDFGNSTITRDGAPVTDRSPSAVNTLSVDADDLDITLLGQRPDEPDAARHHGL